MQHVILIFCLITTTVYGQKTTNLDISNYRGLLISRNIMHIPEGADTIFFFMGQNAKYQHITDIADIKHGKAKEIYDLLTECMKFLPEASGNSLQYQGNVIMAMGNKRVMLFGTGRDDGKYVILTANLITRLQSDLKPHL